MKFTTKILLLLFTVGVFGSATAQKNKTPNFKEGIIKYAIEIEGMPEAAQFVNSSVINVYLKEKNSKMDISIMGGMASFQFINNMKDQLMTMLMDVPSFYEKTAVDIDENSEVFKELSQGRLKNQAPEKEIEVKYFKNKKKRIAKYPCYKAEVSMGSSAEKLTMYLTEKLRPEAVTQVERSMGEMQGFPLGFEIEVEGMLIRVMAVEVLKQVVDAEAFQIPENYTRKSLDEFKDEIQQKMGGANGGIGL